MTKPWKQTYDIVCTYMLTDAELEQEMEKPWNKALVPMPQHSTWVRKMIVVSKAWPHMTEEQREKMESVHPKFRNEWEVLRDAAMQNVVGSIT